MKKHKILIQIIIGLISFSCQDKLTQEDNPLYFDEYELSDDNWVDSLSNRQFSKELFLLNEESLKDTLNKNETIRLTVFPSFFNTYCIRVDKIDSMYSITFKMAPDRKSDLRKTGLNGLTLNYKSDFEKMDSIYQDLKKDIDRFDLFSHDNSTPEKALNLTPADGTDFLLEHRINGRHIALVRWNGFLYDSIYDKSPEFMRIIGKMKSLVPTGILPNLETPRKIEDIRFTIFKDNNVVAMDKKANAR